MMNDNDRNWLLYNPSIKDTLVKNNVMNTFSERLSVETRASNSATVHGNNVLSNNIVRESLNPPLINSSHISFGTQQITIPATTYGQKWSIAPLKANSLKPATRSRDLHTTTHNPVVLAEPAPGAQGLLVKMC